MGRKGNHTWAGLFGMDRRDVCHVDGSGSVVDSSFELLCLDIGHIGCNQIWSCELMDSNTIKTLHG